MRWRTGRQSDNVEDRRGLRAAPAIAGGGIGTIVLLLIAIFFGVDPTVLLQSGPPVSAPSQQSAAVPADRTTSQIYLGRAGRYGRYLA